MVVKHFRTKTQFFAIFYEKHSKFSKFSKFDAILEDWVGKYERGVKYFFFIFLFCLGVTITPFEKKKEKSFQPKISLLFYKNPKIVNFCESSVHSNS